MSEIIDARSQQQVDDLDRDKWREVLDKYYNKKKSSLDEGYYQEVLKHLISRKDALIDNRDERSITEEMKRNQAYYNLTEIDEYFSSSFLKKQSSYNVIRSCINTERSKLGKDKPKVNILTENAPYELYIQGKKADQYIETQFKLSDIYDAASDVLLQGNIKKTGILKCVFDKQEEKFKCSSINPYNFYCYIPEEMGGITNQKEVLEVIKTPVMEVMKMYPDKKDMLSKVFPDNDGCVDVYELYYEGEWKVCFIEECLLKVEKNKRNPYFYWRWTDDSENKFWGNGLADELMSIQKDINSLLYMIKKSGHDVAVPKILINRAAKVIRSHITNEIGAIMEWSGRVAPDVLNPPVLHQQYFEHLNQLVDNAYKIASGVSQMSTSGSAPASLMRSGKSMETYHNIEQERFYDTSKKFQQLFVKVAQYMLCEASEHYMSAKSEYDFVKDIDWKVLDVKKNLYRIQSFPVSLLSESPAGRLAEVQTLSELNAFEPDQIIKMLNYPDIERVTALTTATRDAVHKLCNKIIEGESEDVDVDTVIPVEIQLREASKYYGQAIKQNLPENKLELLREYIDKIKAMIQPLQAPMGQTEVSPQQEAGLGAGAEANVQNLGAEQLG